jgi:hypothetical protein
MASITFIRATNVAGTSYSVADVLSATLAIAGQLVAEGMAKWTNAATVRPLPNVPERVVFLSDVTALTGDAPTGLNGYLVANIPVGRIFDVKLTAETGSRRYAVITKDGEVPDADSIIEPPDFDATGNNKLLLRIA